ncbi:unnamed protein product, partial [marine sediment metagenome]
ISEFEYHSIASPAAATVKITKVLEIPKIKASFQSRRMTRMKRSSE